MGEFLIQFVCYGIGRVVVTAISSGRWKCEFDDEGQPEAKERKKWNWGYYVRNGQVYLNSDLVALIGLLGVLAIIGVCAGIWYLYTR